MKKINIDFSKENLDIFLNENYGYGYWNFADSLLSVYYLYKFRDFEKERVLIKERIEYFEKIKQKIIEILDQFLREIDFYKTSKYHYSLNKKFNYKWTPNNKREFILNRLQLKHFFSEFDEIIKQYKSHNTMNYFENDKIYLKPINFVILIWSHAIKKKGRIEWINMEKLIQWFLKILEEIDVLDIYGIESKDIPSPDRMRFIYNRYKGTIHGTSAFSFFMKSFQDEEKISRSKEMSFISINAEKIDYSDPLKYLDEHLWFDKTPKAWRGLYDLGVTYHLLEK